MHHLILSVWNMRTVHSVWQSLWLTVTTESFRIDFNPESNTFPCLVQRETALGNTMSNPFIKICPQKHPRPWQCYDHVLTASLSFIAKQVTLCTPVFNFHYMSSSSSKLQQYIVKSITTHCLFHSHRPRDKLSRHTNKEAEWCLGKRYLREDGYTSMFTGHFLWLSPGSIIWQTNGVPKAAVTPLLRKKPPCQVFI